MSFPVVLLAAGACYSSNNGAFQRCALQPLECVDVYRTNRWMAENDAVNAATCAAQGSIHNIPALGRCDSESERYICTSHASACRNSISFRPLDADCTVTADYRPNDTPFVESYYGECDPTEDVGKVAGKEPYCAWKFSECESGGLYTFENADAFFASGLPKCQCDDVQTGACVSTTDPSDYFCAVTEEVCLQEAGWTYSKSYDVQANLGVTCKLCDTLPPPHTTRYAEAGACIVSATNEFKRCALIPDHCDEAGEDFYSPNSLATMTASNSIPEAAKACATQEGLYQVRVGRCVAFADMNICVSDASACRNTVSFQANDDDCRLVEDLDTTADNAAFSTTHYGHCTSDSSTTFSGYEAGRENYCSWSALECKATSANARPLDYGLANPGMSGSQPTCQCDDVRIVRVSARRSRLIGIVPWHSRPVTQASSTTMSGIWKFRPAPMPFVISARTFRRRPRRQPPPHRLCPPTTSLRHPRPLHPPATTTLRRLHLPRLHLPRLRPVHQHSKRNWRKNWTMMDWLWVPLSVSSLAWL